MISIILIVFIIIIIYFLTHAYMEVKSSKLYSFYLGIVSFVSIIAIGINLWIVLTSIWKYYIVTDEEYLQFNQSYRLTECKNPTYTSKYDNNGNALPRTTVTQTPSDEEIAKCEAKVRSEVKFSRAYDLKDMFITSGAWFVVFVLFFLFHYPKFVRQKEENTEKEEEKKEEKPEVKKTAPKKTTKKAQ